MTRVRNQEVHSIPHPLESNGQKWEVESCSRYLARDIEGHVVQLVCIRLEVAHQYFDAVLPQQQAGTGGLQNMEFVDRSLVCGGL